MSNSEKAALDADTRPVPIFIDEHINIYEGKQAAAHLRAKTGTDVPDPEYGVTQVGNTRWQEAQRYERRSWLEKGRWGVTDRNEHHQVRFANYVSLSGRKFKRGIELGCGPFTNLRLILEHCAIEQIYLLDPLISDYRAHPFCRYQHGRLGGIFSDNLARLPVYLRHPRGFLQNKINDWKIGGWFGRSLVLESSMIEAYQPDQRFNLVVMINVLEHCQDAMAVLNKIDELLTPDGVLVFHERLYQAREVERVANVIYDAGHPLRVAQPVIDEFLDHHFIPLMRAQYLVQSEFRGSLLHYHDLYFIGKKH